MQQNALRSGIEARSIVIVFTVIMAIRAVLKRRCFTICRSVKRPGIILIVSVDLTKCSVQIFLTKIAWQLRILECLYASGYLIVVCGGIMVF